MLLIQVSTRKIKSKKNIIAGISGYSESPNRIKLLHGTKPALKFKTGKFVLSLTFTPYPIEMASIETQFVSIPFENEQA
jgi:hypothetical protein